MAPTPRVARGLQLADQLRAAGVNATHVARELAGRLPGVLVPPPARVAFDVSDSTTCTWRLLLVASTADEDTAWPQLDELLTAVEAVLPVEYAEPTRAAVSGADPLPAYACTFTDTVES